MIIKVQEEIDELRKALKTKEAHLSSLEKEIGITALSKISSKVGHTLDQVKKSAV